MKAATYICVTLAMVSLGAAQGAWGFTALLL
jgi:hypothetical protein